MFRKNYKFSYLGKEIHITTNKKLTKETTKNIEELIAYFIEEITIKNITSSFERFNNAPINFPIKIYTIFIDYIAKVYTTLFELDLLNLAFDLDKKVPFEEMVFYDLNASQIIKKQKLTMKRKLLATPALLTMISHIIDLDIENIKYEIIYENKKIIKTKQIMASIDQSYDFEFYGFTMKNKKKYRKELTLVNPNLCLLEAFTFKFVNNEEELKKLLHEYEIEIFKEQDHDLP
ncbi:MAG: hypothetical protein KatS3mg085_183 [Candidatus Dojkabacteria bacterium]|nr:MAG: hypothetical protein KatS3mg085_183 [Candidatus Dojkabacteria bacterium]